jgi:hypothetical protein
LINANRFTPEGMTMDPCFDPFNDRVARNIRNSLSSALISELTRSEPDAVARVASGWERRQPAPVYQAYVRSARQHYRQVLHDIRLRGIEDPRRQAVMLWNAGLFFELHELLETIWHGVRGAEHNALKGLIQAAGAYVHSLRGKADAAQGLAGKARQNLLAGCECLNFIANVDRLIDALEQPVLAPPHLILTDPATAAG